MLNAALRRFLLRSKARLPGEPLLLCRCGLHHPPLLFAGFNSLFPFFAPILGWLGVFLTSSDTSSNALFCGMQRSTAQAVGMPPNSP